MTGTGTARLEDIIDWLISIEELAGDVYARAAGRFPDDEALSRFLEALARDEREHYGLMLRSKELVSGSATSPLVLDDGTREVVEGAFEKCAERLDSDGLTKESLIECVVSTEYSEWNTFFLYVVNTLKRANGEFAPAAASIEQHKRGISDYLKSDGSLAGYLARIEALEVIWEEKILVVDDSSDIADVLTAVLEKEGAVVVAANGEEALARLAEGYYAAVVSDVNMPVMNGVEFFKEAAARYPGIRERFIFFTSEGDPAFLAFVKENGIRLLHKPASVASLRKAVADVIRG